MLMICLVFKIDTDMRVYTRISSYSFKLATCNSDLVKNVLQRPDVIGSKVFFNDVLAAQPGRKGFSDERFTFRGDGDLLLPFVHAITVNLQPPLTHQNGDVSSYRGTIQPGDITEPGKAYGIIVYHQLHQRILRNIDAIGIQLGVVNSGHLT